MTPTTPLPRTGTGGLAAPCFAAAALLAPASLSAGQAADGAPAPVSCDPPQTKVWEDFRDGGGSPWSAGWQPPPVPPGNRWVVRAAFSEPGTYVLRCLAHDGGLQSCEDVTLHVRR